MKTLLALILCALPGTFWAQDSTDPLTDSLFHAFATVDNSSVAYQAELANLKSLAAQLRTKFNTKKPEKSLRKIYDAVHDRYFTKYVENPVFSDIFSRGQYNCVTASALYAFLFEEMSIPYEIRETPTHVYVVAYPGTHKFIVESTLPTEGILNLKKKEVENLKETLVANKMITAQEAAKDNFAQEYIFSDTTITLTNLFGVQLYNHSITLSEGGKYRQAAEVLSTALRYHQTLYIRQVSMLNLAMMLKDPMLSMEGKCFITTESYQLFSELGLDPLQETLATVNGFIPKGIPDKTEAMEMQKLASCVTSAMIDSILANEISNSANLVSGFYHYNVKEIDEALHYLAKITDVEFHQSRLLIVDVVGLHLDKVTNMHDGLDSLKKYETVFPFIKTDFDLQGFGAFFYLRLIYEHVELEELQEALKVLDAFEARFKPDDDVRFKPEFIGQAYGALSSHFVRSGDEEKAKAYLKRGMKYAKDSLELRRKLKLLESDSW